MTWFLTAAIMGAVVWQAGPMTRAECEANKPSVIARVDSMTNKQGIVHFQGRTAARRDVKVYCTQDEAR